MTRAGVAATRHLGAPMAAVVALTLAACTPAEPPQAPPAAPVPPPPPPPVSTAPARKPKPPVDYAALRRERAEAARAEPAPPSDASAVMAGYLQRIEAGLLSRGLLRTGREADAPLTVDQLTEDFVQIALRNEYASPGAPSAGAAAPPAPLRRWPGEVRLQLEWGASVAPATRVADRAAVASLAGRLAAASRHPVRLVGDGGNFIVAVVSDDDRRTLAPRLAQLVPGIPPGDLDALTQLSPQNFCTAFSYGEAGGDGITRAVALIRAELPPRLRTACFEEELAQGMGLPNDSPAAQPSVFNDDQRQAVLTRHDELLLAMLYDPRLRPGMTEAEARPIAATIAAELLASSPAAP